MNDPEKEKFILKSIEAIKTLRDRVIQARKNQENMDDVIKEVQEEIERIKAGSEKVFESREDKMSPQELEEHLQNPSNFSREDWELLENIKTETEGCKREILKFSEKDSIEELIGKKKGNKLKKNLRGKA